MSVKWHSFFFCFFTFVVTIVERSIELIFTQYYLGIILWVRTIYQPSIFNFIFEVPRCYLFVDFRYFVGLMIVSI